MIRFPTLSKSSKQAMENDDFVAHDVFTHSSHCVLKKPIRRGSRCPSMSADGYKKYGNYEKELPIRQCTTSSALPPKAVSATKQCVIHIWKGRPSAGRVPAASRPATGSKGARNSSFFFAKYVCQGQGSEGVAGSDAKSNTYIHSVIETGWYLGKYLMSAIVFKNLSLLSN